MECLAPARKRLRPDLRSIESETYFHDDHHKTVVPRWRVGCSRSAFAWSALSPGRPRASEQRVRTKISLARRRHPGTGPRRTQRSSSSPLNHPCLSRTRSPWCLVSFRSSSVAPVSAGTTGLVPCPGFGSDRNPSLFRPSPHEDLKATHIAPMLAFRRGYRRLCHGRAI